ncbi:unnamed protein product [Diatraea saccharalis]|uniref:HTH psq-type domain-containing protein n=1 Tax=Diatraea saccharalis TaxID=40085 RepID=A0A9N9RE56_9NEOP|nr:unnamed protein product [Diatraea saccharalis]
MNVDLTKKGLERVAEELMGRRKWKLCQDALIPKRSEPEASSDESMPGTDPPPALKIKTIEQINAPEAEEKSSRPETILESLIKRPATQPKLELPEPTDWKPPDKCYFCVDGERGEPVAEGGQGGATSPASESDSSSVSGAKSPAGAPPLLQHLLQLQLQAQIPADGSGPGDAGHGAGAAGGAVPVQLSLPSGGHHRQTPSTGRHIVSRINTLKRGPLDVSNNVTRRAYTDDELQSALRDIQSGRLGTRRAAVVYGIPRSTLRNKVNKFGLATEQHDSEADSDSERPESPPSVILKIPTFPPPDDKSPSPATPVTTPITPITPIIPPPQPPLNPSAHLPAFFADPPANQHLFTSINDVIVRSISQKFQQLPDRPTQASDLQYMRAPDRHVSVIKTPPENQRNYQMPSNSKATNNGQPATGGKGTRPKRGKYRNYDRDSLVEAVKAVQRGEMSVHRAGSYYGVPHSTLEYKVKERHLMRPRKREPKPQQDPKPPPKPQPKAPPTTKPFSNGMNGPDTPAYPTGYPFWAGAGFPPPSPDLYASHMMRRLREEAPPPANGSFLEGIIRSSLERPGAALMHRLTEQRPLGPQDAPSLLRRLTGEPDEPPARRARLDSSDRQLAAEMREAVQRLRADKLRPRNGTPTPPAPSSPSPAPAPAPPDRT